jgi:hypothetical protein
LTDSVPGINEIKTIKTGTKNWRRIRQASHC